MGQLEVPCRKALRQQQAVKINWAECLNPLWICCTAVIEISKCVFKIKYKIGILIFIPYTDAVLKTQNMWLCFQILQRTVAILRTAAFYTYAKKLLF